MNVILINFERDEFPIEVETQTETIQTDVDTSFGITCTRIFTYTETRTGEDGMPLLVYKELMFYP